MPDALDHIGSERERAEDKGAQVEGIRASHENVRDRHLQGLHDVRVARDGRQLAPGRSSDRVRVHFPVLSVVVYAVAGDTWERLPYSIHQRVLVENEPQGIREGLELPGPDEDAVLVDDTDDAAGVVDEDIVRVEVRMTEAEGCYVPLGLRKGAEEHLEEH